MNMTRRSILIAGAAGAIAASGATPALGAPRPLRSPRTTVVVSPHPDDETLYLSGYITYAAACGDRLILLAVSDGGATKARPAGWTVDELMAVRRTEQEAAWRALTNDRGEIIRLGLADGSRAGFTAPVRDAVQKLDGSDVEFYVAANDGQSMDHVGVVQGVRTSGVRVARYANETGSRVGHRYEPSNLDACRVAASCYLAVGQRSVPSMFARLEQNGYVTRVTP